MTLASEMLRADHRPSGFDYMRLILSLGVVVSHSVLYCYGDAIAYQFWDSPARPVLKLILPMFFALSGFLVAGSLERSQTLVNFLGLRFIRIYPALTVEVLLSALLIGTFVTMLPLGEYFTHPDFLRYLVNVTGHISYYLPGVFETNPFPRQVNSQLWTVPYELKCYIVLAILFVLGLKRRKFLVWIALALVMGRDLMKKAANDWQGLESPGVIGGEFLVPFFLAGVAMYLYRDRIAFNWVLFAISAVLSVVLLSYVTGGEYLGVIPATYFTVFLGLCNPVRSAFSRAADYSYGIFLYGAVVQQTIVHLFPDLREWYWNILIALPICFVIGWVSWNWIEKPMMGFRGQIKASEKWWIGVKTVLAARAVAIFKPQSTSILD
ncbi:acyltransferase family protein [Asticcacaulis machinosus]|uniref:Acyltransferase n=1 Tax=Asticcacaulis machinosus TaxID=2984211 RepID=A0ABT5HGK8_9CAUL|nr:acyltransferase [Asticcacaulis machinosus]MDC7675395.1 acyltransferase [Asticcacaulis machinosus]